MNTDRHSFKSDQTDALSLSVYNVGYENVRGFTVGEAAFVTIILSTTS